MSARMAERLNTLRGTNRHMKHCAGCGVKDTRAKLVVERMGAYHPPCYRAMVRRWPS